VLILNREGQMKISVMKILILLLTGSQVSCGSVSKEVRKAFPSEYGVWPPVRMTISSFQQGRAVPASASFSVYIPKELAEDLEFKEYAGLLSAFLVRSGYTPTRTDQSDFSVILSYSIDGGRTEVYTTSNPTYGMISSGTTQYHTGSIYSYSTGSTYGYSGTSTTGPIYGQTGRETTVHSRRVYRREVEAKVVDMAASKQANKVIISSSVKIMSEGNTGVLRKVMPIFLSAVVTNIGRTGVFSETASSVPFFASSESEAQVAISRVPQELRPDLLIYSAQNGDYLTVRSLLREGMNPNTRGGKKNRTALEWAVYSKNEAVVRQLLNAGANVDEDAIEQAKNVKQANLLSLLISAKEKRE